MEYIACDAHKRYTQVSVETVDGERRYEGRIAHARGALQRFLETRERGSPVAVETVGNWDLDCGRDRSGGPGPAIGPRAQGEAHARHGQQDRAARRARAEPVAADRHAPHRVDPAGGPPGSTRPSPHPYDPPAGAHPPQEPHPRHPGQGPGCASRGRPICSAAGAASGSRRRSPSSRRTTGTRRNASLHNVTS